MSFLRHLSRSQLVRGSFLVFIGSNTASFGNFLYNLLMGRFLGPVLYGDLGAMFSLLILISIPLSVINIAVVKTVSSYWGKKDRPSVKSLFICLTPRLFILGIAISLILLAGSTSLASFLRLSDWWPMVLLSSFLIFSVVSTANRGILSGTLSFSYLTINGFIEISLKLAISVVLVFFNFKLIGALTGPLVAIIISYLLSYFEISYILKDEKQRPCTKFSIGKIIYSFLPFLIITLSLNMMINLDIILVKHFFDARTAGDYVALSTVGKIIFYIVGPLITVMFPLISSRSVNGTPYLLPLLGTLAISLGLNLVLVFLYFLFPKEIINLLFGTAYTGAIPYMGLFAFFIAVYTADTILTYFLISISYYRPVYYLFLISLLQGIFIIIFHDSIARVININIIVSMIYLCVISYFVLKKEAGIIPYVCSRLSKSISFH